MPADESGAAEVARLRRESSARKTRPTRHILAILAEKRPCEYESSSRK